MLRKAQRILSASALLLAAACGGGGGGGGSPPPPPAPATFAVGGTVVGLTGTGNTLVLQNNGGNNLTITANGAFSFSTRLATGAAYDVNVSARPTAPSQACVVGNGDGTIASANVTNINVVCGPAPGKFLYATYDDPVILRGYTINAITGGLSLIGGSAAPSGSNVSALTASPSGQFLYTANTALGSISGYSINQITGSLTEISGSPFAAATNLAALTFRPDGTFAYAPYYQNFVAAFSVNATTGALTLLGGSPYTVGIQPGEAVIDPTGKFIYVPSGGSQELYGFAIHPTEGTLAAVPGSPYTSMRQRDLKIWVGASATILYVSNASTGAIPNDSSVSAYQINPSTGQLSEIMGSPFGDGTAGGRIRISADNRFLFIAGTNSNGGAAISSFSIHQTTGALTLVPPVPTPAVGSPNSIQVGNAGFNVSYDVDVSGRYIAVAYPTGTAATIIPINTATGALGSAASPSLTYTPSAGLLDRSGLFAYVLQYAGPVVHPYQIEPISFFVTELPAASLGSGIAIRQAVIVGSQ